MKRNAELHKSELLRIRTQIVLPEPLFVFSRRPLAYKLGVVATKVFECEPALYSYHFQGRNLETPKSAYVHMSGRYFRCGKYEHMPIHTIISSIHMYMYIRI